jgi:hypothetical protein
VVMVAGGNWLSGRTTRRPAPRSGDIPATAPALAAEAGGADGARPREPMACPMAAWIRDGAAGAGGGEVVGVPVGSPAVPGAERDSP